MPSTKLLLFSFDKKDKYTFFFRMHHLNSWNLELESIFWNFATFQKNFHSPQVKLYLISTTKIIICDLHYKLSNDLRLRILEIGNSRKASKLGRNRVPSLLSRNKIAQKQLPKVSVPDQFCLISLLCSKYFVQDGSFHLNSASVIFIFNSTQNY